MSFLQLNTIHFGSKFKIIYHILVKLQYKLQDLGWPIENCQGPTR